MTSGTINHVAITVSNLDEALCFFEPLLDALGFTYRERGEYAGTRLAMHLNPKTQIGINIWQAKGEFADQTFDVYAPGLHHLALNAESNRQVDAIADIVRKNGGTILDGPGEFPFAIGGYYAVYFTGPDGMKFEVVHMPELSGNKE
ncbi:VOC family protein [Altererythrobacter xiamenensis]|uniref:VOC family protein n=1 Tax=Altererythrobacter xiamenensis TaxID=1316679 RepID=UPI0013563CA1|nr:VOC family protein [Altererythrobacter xiamenensis]